jgi:hypothetical protein
LTVRINAVRRHGQPRCNIDTPTASRLNVRDDREAPLLSRRDGVNVSYISEKKKVEYFCAKGWTGVMQLNWLAK